jgi:cbb3-type cytochrome oxidase subunit 3
MMKNLDWKAGLRRAAMFMVLYAVILYVMSVAFPESFGIGQEQLPGLLLNAVFFFLILATFFAFTEKRRAQRIAEMKAQRKGKQDRPEKEDGEPGPLKGRPNPNTSRKKTRRRR